jgi:FMN-dependent NADH-azoreductase
MNHTEPYLRTILSFVGVTDLRFIAAGGTSSLASGSVDRPTFLEPVLAEIRAAV